MASHLLYLVRHGLAAEQAPSFRMTTTGRSRATASSACARRCWACVNSTSASTAADEPLVRAAQTAEILAPGSAAMRRW